MNRNEFEFNLPVGFVDANSQSVRHGVMRLATALDEIEPLNDPRVQSNEAYLGVLLLARTIKRLGNLEPVPVQVIEQLFAIDYGYLQAFYVQINEGQSVLLFDDMDTLETECPHCQTRFALDLNAWQGTEGMVAMGHGAARDVERLPQEMRVELRLGKRRNIRH